MKTAQWKKGLVAAALVVAAGCTIPGLGSSDRAGQGGDDKQLSGAIFTTTSDGTKVNENHYATTCEVYLNGGPERDGSAGLPAGDYYFQVTDPSGMVLLSSDEVTARQVTVDDSGRFVSAQTHVTSANAVDGGVAVQLCPFDLSPNPGCVHKVWLTPVEDYDLEARNANFGFVESRSKTDNFKVCEEVPPEEGVCGDEVLDEGEECDDGNTTNGDGCDADCKGEDDIGNPYCGDGTIDEGEVCDDGNRNDGDDCRNDCTPPDDDERNICGDGVTEGEEECDDGNTKDGDGCSRTCVEEPA